ncbi:hypothetical protein BY996DRAFT_6409326 [Phakopsora pachyrhizi]|nr:hypothetical protein BY996DRAFT_6409326 [Phakopsora pachyrhizi]
MKHTTSEAMRQINIDRLACKNIKVQVKVKLQQFHKVGSKTWYPELDERNGGLQLVRAQERAHQNYIKELDRLENIRRNQCLRTFGKPNPLSDLEYPLCNAQPQFQQAGPKSSQKYNDAGRPIILGSGSHLKAEGGGGPAIKNSFDNFFRGEQNKGKEGGVKGDKNCGSGEVVGKDDYNAGGANYTNGGSGGSEGHNQNEVNGNSSNINGGNGGPGASNVHHGCDRGSVSSANYGGGKLSDNHNRDGGHSGFRENNINQPIANGFDETKISTKGLGNKPTCGNLICHEKHSILTGLSSAKTPQNWDKMQKKRIKPSYLVAKSNFLRLVVNKRTKLLAIFLGKKNPSTGLYISRRDCHWVATPRPQYPVAAWLSHLSDEESSYSREKIRSTIRGRESLFSL